MSLRIGSLFSGYAGLEMGVQSVVGGTVAWHCEFDAAPSKILAHHWPDVPNLGDITAVDWTAVEPVDVLTGGSPCQDVSAAGRRAGMRAGTRSGLWASMTDAIDQLRPGLVVWENVRGVLSAEADSAPEPCAGCVGDGDDGPVLRALGRVLGDLSELGYDTQWCGLRAADVGAPHGRYRVFVVATDAQNLGYERRGPARRGWTGLADGRGSVADSGCGGWWEEDPRGRDLVGQGGIQAGRNEGAGSPRPDREPATHPDVSGSQGSEPARGRHLPDRGAATDTERVSDRPARRTGSAFVGCKERSPSRTAGHHRSHVQWGPYRPAIERWGRVLGRLAPPPTELAPKGGQRLSPRFVEWMMGLPDGHVTDPAIGISRNEQLKALGNGVVPQQATAALRHLLNCSAVAA